MTAAPPLERFRGILATRAGDLGGNGTDSIRGEALSAKWWAVAASNRGLFEGKGPQCLNLDTSGIGGWSLWKGTAQSNSVEFDVSE